MATNNSDQNHVVAEDLSSRLLLPGADCRKVGSCISFLRNVSPCDITQKTHMTRPVSAVKESR